MTGQALPKATGNEWLIVPKDRADDRTWRGPGHTAHEAWGNSACPLAFSSVQVLSAGPPQTSNVVKKQEEASEIEKLRRELDESKTALENWKLAVRTSAMRCATCEGDGFMAVVVGWDLQENEMSHTEVCGECAGTGLGQVADMIRADREELEAWRAIAERVGFAHVSDCHATVVDAAAREAFSDWCDRQRTGNGYDGRDTVATIRWQP